MGFIGTFNPIDLGDWTDHELFGPDVFPRYWLGTILEDATRARTRSAGDGLVMSMDESGGVFATWLDPEGPGSPTRLFLARGVPHSLVSVLPPVDDARLVTVWSEFGEHKIYARADRLKTAD